MTEKTFNETGHTFYKPRTSGGGSALKFLLNKEKKMCFLEFASQLGTEKKFDWENKIIFKLSIDDLGKMKSVLEGREESLKSYHATDSHNTNFELNLGQSSYIISISKKILADGSINRCSLSIMKHEASLLVSLLNYAIPAVIF